MMRAERRRLAGSVAGSRPLGGPGRGSDAAFGGRTAHPPRDGAEPLRARPCLRRPRPCRRLAHPRQPLPALVDPRLRRRFHHPPPHLPLVAAARDVRLPRDAVGLVPHRAQHPPGARGPRRRLALAGGGGCRPRPATPPAPAPALSRHLTAPSARGASATAAVAAVAALPALARSPRLWPTAFAVAAAHVPRRWWARWPPLPLPDRGWAGFRLETAFGDPRQGPKAEELIDWLQWCRAARHARRNRLAPRRVR